MTAATPHCELQFYSTNSRDGTSNLEYFSPSLHRCLASLASSILGTSPVLSDQIVLPCVGELREHPHICTVLVQTFVPLWFFLWACHWWHRLERPLALAIGGGPRDVGK